MFAYVTIIIASLFVLSTFFTARKYAHLRRMAIRNLFVHKQTTVLTVIGAMVGTALITTSLLLDYSISQSVDRVYEEQLGTIVGDVSAIGQKELANPYFLDEDLQKIKNDNRRQDWQVAGLLPIVSNEMLLMKLDENGQPLILNPKTYVLGVEEEAARNFDEDAVEGISLSSLNSDEIILSERTASKLEVGEGDQVVVVDVFEKKHTFTVAQIVPERGITGYRGTNRATSTAIVSLETARGLVEIDEAGYTNVLTSQHSTNANIKSFHIYSPGGNWYTVPVGFYTSNELEKSSKLLPIFTISSITAVIIGMALIMNVFKMVAEERRKEFGILRAIGLSEGDLSRLLKIEGSIYGIISGFIGMIVGVGLAYFLVLQIRDILSTTVEYTSGLSIRYEFSVSVVTLLTGFSIGLILIYLCIAFITRKAVKISIVNALAVTDSEGIYKSRLTPFRIGVTAVLMMATISLFILTKSTAYIESVSNSAIQPLINLAVSLGLLLLLVSIFIIGLPVIFTLIKWVLRPFPKLNGVLNLSLRYPEVNPTRTGMLIFMFSLVLFLTSFAGVFSKTMESHFSTFDQDTATAGYDLLAKNVSGTWEIEDIEKMVASSKYIVEKELQEVTVVSQANVDGFYDKVNGIDNTFANGNTITLLQRERQFSSDRDVWQAVVNDPSLVVVSEFRLDRFLEPGDVITFQTATGQIQKRVAAIAKYEHDSYEFPTSYGMWMSEEGLLEIVSDARLISKTILLKVEPTTTLAQTARAIEKEFTLNNIYPLINPTEMAVVSSSFIVMFFALFEGFNALATIIGIIGLMVVMIRVIRERRQQIGMLRAIGISPRLIYWSYLIEGAAIAIIGITIGIVVGAYGGDMMLQSLMNDGNEEIQRIDVIFPYAKISLYYLASIFLTLLLIALPARATMKLSPAEATRYIS